MKQEKLKIYIKPIQLQAHQSFNYHTLVNSQQIITP